MKSAHVGPCRVERTTRSVIEHRLLVALEANQNQVAILATRQDLEDMIAALENYNWNQERKARCIDLARGMIQLVREAFPQ